jgi:hypothetical protein
VDPSTFISSFSTGTWLGSFEVTDNDSSLFFRGEGNGDGTSTHPTTGSLDSFFGDPPGTWTNVAVAAAPDSGSTLSLLAAACAGLGACHRLVRRARAV